MKALAALASLLAAGLCMLILVTGFRLAAPAQSAVGPPPAALGAESVAFPSASGAMLKGWLAPGRPGGGAVVLMHGVRADRRAMLRRALVLHAHGFGVLLFDFQAHGESLGREITFGRLEALDAAAAVAFARERLPGERLGAIGVSLGGAAALLGPEPLAVDALVLESVYPDIHAALRDRLRVRFGRAGAALLTPLFELILRPALGLDEQALRPIDRIGEARAALLLASGSADAYTPLAEARALAARAPRPAQLWPVEGAAHVDLERYAPEAYWAHVLPFLAARLQQG